MLEQVVHIFSTVSVIQPHNLFQAHYRRADKSLARPGMKQATATEGFEFHISYL
jgi:hypothetical protein